MSTFWQYLKEDSGPGSEGIPRKPLSSASPHSPIKTVRKKDEEWSLAVVQSPVVSGLPYGTPMDCSKPGVGGWGNGGWAEG